jgi:hypothetical protein
MGDVSLQIMPPPGIPDWNQNDNSIGIVVEYGLLDELVAELADCVDIELPKQPIALALAVTKETAFDDVPDLFDAFGLDVARLGVRDVLCARSRQVRWSGPLPTNAVQALQESQSDDSNYFFWNSSSQPITAVRVWERTFQRVFELA